MAADASSEEALEFELPRRFGRYVLFDRIGRGGMADIYLARGTTQMGASRRVVVKLVLPHLASDPGFAAMLISEARLAARLSHRNVVQTFDLGREASRLYIAMEYVEGYDLTQLLKKLRERRVPLPAEYGFFIVCEMLRGLDYAHRRRGDDGEALGIVHRDVSPSNVLISLEGEVKLCDFGIARALTDLDALPEGALEGKAAYMSPEHARGEKVDARADVFSAATILWEILSGRRMYKAQPGRDVLDVAKAGEVPPLPTRSLPEYDRIAGVLAKGLAPNREDRYPSAAALLRDLEDYAERNRFIASPMRFGKFLTEHFEAELVEIRRQREHAALGLAEIPEIPVEVIPSLPVRAPSAPDVYAPSPPSTDEVPDLDALAQIASSKPPSPTHAAPQSSLEAPSVPAPSPVVPAPTPHGPEGLPAPPSVPPVAPSKRSPVLWVAALLAVVAVALTLALATK
jgi:serine/threonine-protein kinase